MSVTAGQETGETVEAHPVVECCGRPIVLRLTVVLDEDGDRAIRHADVARALSLHYRSCDP